jgi:hypothetical protein
MIRQRAQQAVLEIAEARPEAIPPEDLVRVLGEMTREPDASIRRQGWENFGQLFPEIAVTRVEKELSAADASQGSELLGALRIAAFEGKLSPAGLDAACRATVRILDGELSSGSVSTALTTLGSLTEAGCGEAGRSLFGILENEDLSEAPRVLAALQVVLSPAPWEHADRFRRLLARDDSASRALAYSLLSTLEGESRSRLGAALRSSSEAPLVAVVAAFLAPESPSEAIAFLEPGPGDFSRLLVATCDQSAMVEMHRAALAELLDRSDPSLRRGAAVRLSLLPAPAPELVESETDADPAVRLAALANRMDGSPPGEAEWFLPAVRDCLETEDLAEATRALRGWINAPGDLESGLRRSLLENGPSELASHLRRAILVTPEVADLIRRESFEDVVRTDLDVARTAEDRLRDAEGRSFARRVLAGAIDGSLTRAVGELRGHGRRTDVEVLLRQWEETSPGLLRDEVEEALGRLVGLSHNQIRTGPNLVREWWRERKHALDVPVVNSPKRR